LNISRLLFLALLAGVPAAAQTADTPVLPAHFDLQRTK